GLTKAVGWGIGGDKCYGDVRALGTLSGSKRLRIWGPGRCAQRSCQPSHPVSCQRLRGQLTPNTMRSLRLAWQICALLGVVHAAPLVSQSIEPAAAREDFDVLWKSIREAHGGLNQHVAPAARSPVSGSPGAPRAVDDGQGVRGPAAGIDFGARDGHMRLEPDSAT